MSLDEEAARATAMLAGKQVARVWRHRASELLVEFSDGARLFVVGEAPLGLSITQR